MKCLNCDSDINGSFCAHCGQKASTRRFGLNRQLLDDVFSDALQLDKGFFFTVKALVTRPGHDVRDYIAGKRTKYFNWIAFLLIIISVSYFLSGFSTVRISDLVANPQSEKFMNLIDDFSRKNPKLFILMIIPINAFSSFLWFRKARMNFNEHFVLNTYKASAEAMIGMLFTLLMIFYPNIEVLSNLIYLFNLLVLSYAFWMYYQYFSGYGYKKWVLFLRGIMTLLTTFLIQSLISILVAIGIVTGFLQI